MKLTNAIIDSSSNIKCEPNSSLAKDPDFELKNDIKHLFSLLRNSVASLPVLSTKPNLTKVEVENSKMDIDYNDSEKNDNSCSEFHSSIISNQKKGSTSCNLKLDSRKEQLTSPSVCEGQIDERSSSESDDSPAVHDANADTRKLDENPSDLSAIEPQEMELHPSIYSQSSPTLANLLPVHPLIPEKSHHSQSKISPVTVLPSPSTSGSDLQLPDNLNTISAPTDHPQKIYPLPQGQRPPPSLPSQVSRGVQLPKSFTADNDSSTGHANSGIPRAHPGGSEPDSLTNGHPSVVARGLLSSRPPGDIASPALPSNSSTRTTPSPEKNPMYSEMGEAPPRARPKRPADPPSVQTAGGPPSRYSSPSSPPGGLVPCL